MATDLHKHGLKFHLKYTSVEISEFESQRRQ